MTDELRENAVLYALGLLEEQEQGAFAAAVASEPELSLLVDEYLSVLGVIALSAESQEPPASLRAAILRKAVESEVFIEKPDVIVPDHSPAPGKVVPMLRAKSTALPWLLAACLAIGCGVLFFHVIRLERENARIAAEVDLENFRIAFLAAQSPTLPDVSASVAWNAANGTGVLEMASLPAPPKDKTYQLWIFEKDNPAPVSAGVFDPAKGTRTVFRPERPITNAVTFAVSIEVVGGRPQPEGIVVLAGNLQKG